MKESKYSIEISERALGKGSSMTSLKEKGKCSKHMAEAIINHLLKEFDYKLHSIQLR
jgi:hypothetical protein